MRLWSPLFVCVLACIAIALPAHAEKTEKITLAVMPFHPQGGMSEDTTRILDDLVATHMVPYAGYKIITAKDIEGLLGFDALKQAFDCNAGSCAQELGGALGVNQIITGSVSKLGSKVIFTLTRIDTQLAEVLGRGSATTEADDDDQLIDGLAQALATVMTPLDGQPAPKPVVKAPAAAPKAAPVASPVAPPVRVVEASSGGPGAMSWTLWSAGTVSLTAGGAFWMQALEQEKNSYLTDDIGNQWDAYEAPRTARKSKILSAVGGGLVTLGLINWLFFDSEPEAHATIMVSPSNTTVSVGGTW